MGTSKALIEVEGQPLIARVAGVLGEVFSEIVVITSSSEIADAASKPGAPSLAAIADTVTGKGPLAGISAALHHFNRPVFCVACDMPHLRADFIRYMIEQGEGFDAVVPRVGAYDEPLHALYLPSCLDAIDAELSKSHVGPVDNVFKALRVRFIDESEARTFAPNLRMFDNWNTPEDIKKSEAQ